MKINFEKVLFKNILSYGDEIQEYNFSSGIDLVNAVNGAGKSTVIDAVFFGLFGKPFRKIKNGSLINDTNKKKLLTEVYFNIDWNRFYKVKRGQKPNIFVIYEKDLESNEYNEIPEKATTKEYQTSFEEEILKIDETVFRQLISISSNSTSSKPFMELTQKEKESLFQVITDTSIFSHLEQKIKQKMQDTKTQKKDAEYKLEIIENSIQSEQIMVDQAKKQNEDFEKHHSDNIKQTKDNIQNSKDNIQKYTEGIEKLKELKVKYDEKLIELTEAKQELTALNLEAEENTEKELEEYLENYEKNVQKIDNDFYNKVYKQEQIIEDLRIKRQDINTKIQELQIQIKRIDSAKQGSISCKSCETINYLDDISEEEIQNHELYISEVQELKQKVNIMADESKEQSISMTKEKAQDKENFDLKKSELKRKRDNEVKIQKEKNYNYKRTERDKLQEKVNELNTVIESYKEKLLKSKHIKTTLQEHESNLAFYENKLIELNSIKLVDIDETQLNIKKEEQILTKENISSIAKSYQNYNYLLSMISDKGEYNLKGQVIARTVPFLNKGINYFLEKFSLNEFNFIVDENFKEKIISRDNNSEYNSLSNGQKMRISFSIMFSFLKLIEEKAGVSTNLLILDEILDGSLDTAGREELLQILKDEFSIKKDIIIISHNDEVKQKLELFTRLVEIKRDKFSELEIKEI